MNLMVRRPWIWVLLVLAVGDSLACAICVPMPAHTLADRLLASDTVVLAREDPARPFHFRAIETVAGPPVEASIDLFLNSQARHILSVYPDRAMVLGYDAGDGRWSPLGITNPEYERVVRAILMHAGRWRPQESDDAERLDWFISLLGHPDERLHELAYLELGRAPYSEVRRLAPHLPRETLNAMLDDPWYLEWRSLAILMLGESGRSEDQARVRSTLSSKAVHGSSRNLAAWATALVAVDGVDGIRRLRSLYLSGANRRHEELEAVAQALSVHAAADPALRGPVAEVYRLMLEADPGVAPKLVQDLIDWQRWDFAEPIRQARADLAGDPLAAYALGLYLRLAGESAGRAAGPQSTDGGSAPSTFDQSPGEEAR